MAGASLIVSRGAFETEKAFTNRGAVLLGSRCTNRVRSLFAKVLQFGITGPTRLLRGTPGCSLVGSYQEY
jgi:hypothetical protein